MRILKVFGYYFFWHYGRGLVDVADKLIRGEISRGATIALGRSPTNPDELEVRAGGRA